MQSVAGCPSAGKTAKPPCASRHTTGVVALSVDLEPPAAFASSAVAQAAAADPAVPGPPRCTVELGECTLGPVWQCTSAAALATDPPPLPDEAPEVCSAAGRTSTTAPTSSAAT